MLVTALALALAIGRARPWRERAVLGLPVAVGLLSAALIHAVSGSWGGSSVSEKGLFDNYGLGEGLGLASEYLMDVLRGLLLGFYPSQAPVGLGRGWAPLFFPPLGLLLVLLAAARARAAPRRCWPGWGPAP